MSLAEAGKVGFVLLLLVLPGVPVLVYVERKVCAFIQGRVGPNRVGPLGLLQPIADALKAMFKEDLVPQSVDRFLYTIAPLLVFLPPALAFTVIPFGDHWAGVPLVIADFGVGILFLMSFLSVGVYGLSIGGWASNNKYSLLGGLRASAQMISYEIALTLSILTVVVLTQEVRLTKLVELQTGGLFTWNVFSLPGAVACMVFFISALAENNRLPFDLPECEAELVGGYHTEYSTMKFSLFMMGEYVAMMLMSALFVTLFLGGWHFPGLTGGADPDRSFGAAALTVGVFVTKVFAVLFVYVWIRWSLPRFRYDQLMDLGWKKLIPISLGNFALAAVMRVLGWV